jgi:glycosyltransferase involved in cell wall biosynthesis
LLAARATGARLTVFVHGAEWGHDDWRRLEPVTTLVAQQADVVVANSRYTAGLCTDATGRTAIEVIHPGVDHERFHPERTPHTTAGGLTVLFVGHLHPRKGPIVLARAIPLVLEQRRDAGTDEPPVRFVFAGPDRGEAGAVREVIADHGLEASVQIRGAVATAELPDLYRSADVVVFPTVWRTEGFGMVAAEAMACGVPVVASRIAAIPEVVDDGVTGLLFAPGDERELAAKLALLLANEPLRRSMGAAGVERARTFEWSAFAGVADVTSTT